LSSLRLQHRCASHGRWAWRRIYLSSSMSIRQQRQKNRDHENQSISHDFLSQKLAGGCLLCLEETI
jgi:hypothetical protein